MQVVNVHGSIECWSTAVADGAAMLDEFEAGWWANIDLDTLDMRSPFNCVLGQLYGSYYEGREKLGILSGEGDICGFDCYQMGGFDYLNEIWHNLITERRANAA